MKRILVVGISASGKTQFANKLSKTTGLPVFNLDSIFWKDNWTEQNPEEVKSQIAELIDKDKWIIEGYVEPLSSRRIMQADTVIYLDVSGHTALLRGIKRWWKHRSASRPELPTNNTDNLSIKFLLTLLRRDERPEIERALDSSESKVMRLTSQKQVNEFINNYK